MGSVSALSVLWNTEDKRSFAQPPPCGRTAGMALCSSVPSRTAPHGAGSACRRCCGLSGHRFPPALREPRASFSLWR